MGVSEMTRFGMQPEDFGELAQYLRDVIVDDASVTDDVAAFRSRFTELQFCFRADDHPELMERLSRFVAP
jgi:glycine/serine hydroxymethyltransferase